MAADDFYTFAARQQLSNLEAERAQALADLTTFKAAGDYESARLSVQRIADLDAQKDNLINLHQRYEASQRPPAQPDLSAEEKAAKPWSRMTPEDGLELARTSRYARDLDFNDPNVIAGWHEVQRRRQRGE